MSFFETQLAEGNFVISECTSCSRVVWPPSDYCNNCLGKVNWKKSNRTGKIIEFSKKDNDFFCLAEFEKNIRIIGKLKANSHSPEVGKEVILESCRLNENVYQFTMKLI